MRRIREEKGRVVIEFLGGAYTRWSMDPHVARAVAQSILECADHAQAADEKTRARWVAERQGK